MTIREALRKGTRLLQSIGSEEAALEAELLLMHALKLDRVHLYQRLGDSLLGRQKDQYGALLDRRLAHEPTPYITGHKEFFSLDFEVTPAAIIPRPETEVLVQLAIEFARERFGAAPLTLADVGVGSGTIAVAIAHQLPNAKIIATDVSADALALAGRNAERHGDAGRIDFHCGDLLTPVDVCVDIIVANLPYLTTEQWEATLPEIREHEPRSGLDGGPDGLTYIRRLLEQAPEHLKPGGPLFCEIGDEQGAAAAQIARRVFEDGTVEVLPDLAGLDRVIAIYV